MMQDRIAPRQAPCHPRDLYPSEQVVLGATRLWAAWHRRGEPTDEALDRYFAFFSASHAAASHGTLMRNSWIAATRSLTINAVDCKCLSRDEERICHAVAFAQRRSERRAANILGDWLPPAAVRLTMPALQGLGDALAARSFCLPLRHWLVEAPPTVDTWWREASVPASVRFH
ncbi:MAG TPA: hypothetical protein VKA18_15385 [Alphaproteobacteria bacterium]|nr:hypothetical protein [Alphaproteobacteria bacterium]